MTMRTLIIGGNRFFGKRLAEKLVAQGADVTLLNRGNQNDGLGEKVKRLRCDRNNVQQLGEIVAGQSWDIVFDQMCFDYQQAAQACEIFRNKTKKYILTSTQSVYAAGADLVESVFDPYNYIFSDRKTKEADYGEAKRQAEAAFFKLALFPVTALRIPMVFGLDDYTKRFSFHLERISLGQPIYFPNIKAKVSLISSEWAAEVLLRLSQLDFVGPINAANSMPLALDEFVGLLEKHFSKKIVLASQATKENHSPYGIEQDWYMNCAAIKQLGIDLPTTESELRRVLAEYQITRS